MGVSFNGHAGAIDWIQSRFKKAKPATLYFDEIRTPTYTDCLNELCEAGAGQRFDGLYHAGGPRRLSLYQHRADYQPRRRIRSEIADRLPTNHGRPDAAAGRECFDGFQQADRRARI